MQMVLIFQIIELCNFFLKVLSTKLVFFAFVTFCVCYEWGLCLEKFGFPN